LTDNKKAILECLKSLINENITEIEKEKIMEETFLNQINTF
jgi:hypothetical protein